MRQFLLKFQLFFEALLLLITLVLVFMVMAPFQHRWDLTQEKIYSLPRATTGVLRDLKGQRVDALLFFSKDDPMRQGMEIFLQECQRYHPQFQYNFYDPNRRPAIATKYDVTQSRTVILVSQGREERLVTPTEEDFTNAFFRLRYPQDVLACFVMGHGELDLLSQEPDGFSKYRLMLEGYNAKPRGIVLLRDHVPDACQVVVLGGPHFELSSEELGDLKNAFDRGKGLLLLLDPMDSGTGNAFITFAKQFGVALGKNVIVDKMSRVVGGDFLMPVVNRYVTDHPVVRGIQKATFFPLLRSVQPSTDIPPGLEVTPLAMTMDGSWAESDLPNLENGKAEFDVQTDIAGPLPLVVAVERKKPVSAIKVSDPTKEEKASSPGGRMIIVGDSDFLSNAYLELSANKAFGLNIIRWLARDDRFIDVRRPEISFNPLILSEGKRMELLITILGAYPLLFFIYGGLYLVKRSKTS